MNNQNDYTEPTEQKKKTKKPKTDKVDDQEESKILIAIWNERRWRETNANDFDFCGIWILFCLRASFVPACVTASVCVCRVTNNMY